MLFYPICKELQENKRKLLGHPPFKTTLQKQQIAYNSPTENLLYRIIPKSNPEKTHQAKKMKQANQSEQK